MREAGKNNTEKKKKSFLNIILIVTDNSKPLQTRQYFRSYKPAPIIIFLSDIIDRYLIAG